MKFIQFNPKENEVFDFSEMTKEQLLACKENLLRQIAELDAKEPKNMNSEAYEEWGDRHEELTPQAPSANRQHLR